MTENNKELKACPFCSEIRINNIAATGGWLCKCNNCFARTTYYKTREEVITAWNTRHNEAPTGEIGELIEDLNNKLEWNEPFYNLEGDAFISVPLKLLIDCKSQLQQAQKMREACKAQLQQAQKMREALLKIIDVTSGNTVQGEDFLDDLDFIEETAKQAFNNKE